MFKGRIGRKQYWQSAILITIASSIISFPIIFFVGVILFEGAAGSALPLFILNFIIGLPFTITFLGIQSRRLHDFGKPGWIAIVAVLITFVTGFLNAIYPTLWKVPDLIISPLYILYLIYIGLRKGQPEPNNYGEPTIYPSLWSALWGKLITK